MIPFLSSFIITITFLLIKSEVVEFYLFIKKKNKKRFLEKIPRVPVHVRPRVRLCVLYHYDTVGHKVKSRVKQAFRFG